MEATATGEPVSDSAQLSPVPRLPLHIRLVHALVIGFVLALPAIFVLMYMGTRIASEGDIWWHMLAGQWILAHHAVPHSDHFTSFGAGRPWAAYSWLFDLLLFQCFRRYGLVGIFGYVLVMLAAITGAIYHLVRRLQPGFRAAVLLTLTAAYCLLPLSTQRPWLFSILFFVIQLDTLFHARRGTAGDHHAPLRASQYTADFESSCRRLGQAAR